jgi:hypothetical protein
MMWKDHSQIQETHQLNHLIACNSVFSVDSISRLSSEGVLTANRSFRLKEL